MRRKPPAGNGGGDLGFGDVTLVMEPAGRVADIRIYRVNNNENREHKRKTKNEHESNMYTDR